MIMFRRITFLVFVLSILFTLDLSAQSQSGKGVVILEDGQTLFGMVDYHQEFKLVSVISAERTYTYAPTQVQYFQYYDQETYLNRIYKPIEQSHANPSHRRSVPEFLELVMIEDVLILRKQKSILIESVNRDEKGSILAQIVASNPVKAISYDYFVSTDGEHAELIRDFRKQVISKLANTYQASLLQYADDLKLNLDRWEDQYAILTYYHQLKEGSLPQKLISEAALIRPTF